MAGTLALDVVTPDKQLFSGAVDSVTAPGLLGEFGVLPGHIPLLSALGIGNVSYRLGGKIHFLFVAGGFVEVTGLKVTVLAEVAELPESIDVDRARRARERAMARLAGERREEVDYTRARAALHRAMMRIKCHEEARLAGLIAAKGGAR